MSGGWEPETCEKIYRYIHSMVSESVGRVFLETMTGMKETDFDRNDPRASLTGFVDKLNTWLGGSVVDGVLLNVSKEFTDRESAEIIGELRGSVGE